MFHILEFMVASYHSVCRSKLPGQSDVTASSEAPIWPPGDVDSYTGLQSWSKGVSVSQ
jgi:hypothetical protein